MTRKWNAEDDKILFELYDKLSLEELSKRLDRSKNAIKRRYKELKAKDTKSRSDSDRRATYLLAYMAMLKTGRALMFLKGYRPDDGAQHKTVVEMTSAIF